MAISTRRKKAAAKPEEETQEASVAGSETAPSAPASETAQPEETAEQPAKAEPEPAGKEEVTIYDPHGNAHRTYSLERHGENFRELADKYLSHRPGWTAR